MAKKSETKATVASLNTTMISDPLAFIRAGLDDVLAGTRTAGIGTQRAAAGVLRLSAGTGWEYEIDGTRRSLTLGTLKAAHKAASNRETDDVSKAAFRALREYVIGNDPLAKSKADGTVSPTSKAVTASGAFAAKSKAFRDAWALACKLADDGYGFANFTANGFRVMRSDIAPSVMVDKKRHVMAPLVGSPEEQIILDPANSTAFAVVADGEVKSLKSVRHSVAAYMASGAAAGNSRANGQTIKKACDWLVKNLKAEDVTSAETLNAVNAAFSKLSAIINAVNARNAKAANKAVEERVAKSA